MNKNIGNIQSNYQKIMQKGYDMIKKYDFKGECYRLSNFWNDIIPIKDEPIRYLEIGIYYGANIISIADTYCKHNNSEIHCIDPWGLYDGMVETNYSDLNIYKQFIDNINKIPNRNNIIIHRGISNIEVPKLKDDYFDIIYIDGNHEPEYVLEDAVLCFRKLKKDGIMIFDDYEWGGPDLTQRGIDAFLSGYYNKITVLGLIDSQVFLKKN
jgi:predicted O-methyltransferase YrrM